MKNYRVEWTIDLDGKSPEDVAKQALEIMQDKGSTAQFFVVKELSKKQLKRFHVDLFTNVIDEIRSR
jgi:diphthamide synthase subunit DPH2